MSKRNEETAIRFDLPARNVRAIKGFKSEDYNDLALLGLEISRSDIKRMMQVQATMDGDIETMDAGLQALMSPASIFDPIQFLQTWLPGWVEVMTQARKIDQIVGITTAGEWEDEEVVQGFVEPTGTAVPYGDLTNVPLASYNISYLTRTVVRFEEGLAVGILEGKRVARQRGFDGANTKRRSASNQLEIQRNRIGFNGYNSGLGLTYGFLNDPYQPAYVSIANGVTSGTTFWSGKQFSDIQADFRSQFALLRNNSGDNIDPQATQITVAIATIVYDFLTVTTNEGQSVMGWLSANYKNVRIISAPELNGAHGGLNVMIIFADSITDGSSDDGRTYMQIVPTKFMMLGVENRIKQYVEDYSNATAGVMCKRPTSIVRSFGM